MKIAIMGYSGSGKSTLARRLGELYKTDVLHLDSVQWLPGWQERDNEEKLAMVSAFLDEHQHSGWIVEGNYKKLDDQRRQAEADEIILLLFNRISCLLRVIRRYRTYRGKTRPDMGEGCPEKLDWEFVKWVLWESRSKAARQRYRDIQSRWPQKTVILKSQRQLDAYLKKLSPWEGAEKK